MKLNVVLTACAAALLVSCAFKASYRPSTSAEKTEFRMDSLNVYPEDVRKNPAHYAGMRVAWAGIVVSNAIAPVDIESKIGLDTLFQHHYFHWEQNELAGYRRLMISQGGEGQFRTRWRVRRLHEESSEADAVNFASPGKMALVYGTIKSVDQDGTIVLGYHYVRIISQAHFRTIGQNYARH